MELKVVVLVNVVVCVAELVFVELCRCALTKQSTLVLGANLAVGIVSKGRRSARNMFTFLVLTETCYGFQD